MTKEEAKNWLNKLYARADITDEYGNMEDMQPYEEAINMAIKALEQEPRTGHWIYKTIRGEKVPCCSKCGLDNGSGYEFNYCPECGAEMIEPKESEE